MRKKPEFLLVTVFLKNKNIISKIKRSKLTDMLGNFAEPEYEVVNSLPSSIIS